MSESRNHIDLVQIAYEYVKSVVPSDKQGLIQVDSADTVRPTSVNGRFIPDVQFWDGDIFIIGEAKTLNDFERNHSKQQYEAYLEECLKFYGTATLVIAVPWQVVMTAKNYFRRRKQDLQAEFEVVILNDLGGRFYI